MVSTGFKNLCRSRLQATMKRRILMKLQTRDHAVIFVYLTRKVRFVHVTANRYNLNIRVICVLYIYLYTSYFTICLRREYPNIISKKYFRFIIQSVIAITSKRFEYDARYCLVTAAVILRETYMKHVRSQSLES